MITRLKFHRASILAVCENISGSVGENGRRENAGEVDESAIISVHYARRNINVRIVLVSLLYCLSAILSRPPCFSFSAAKLKLKFPFRLYSPNESSCWNWEWGNYFAFYMEYMSEKFVDFNYGIWAPSAFAQIDSFQFIPSCHMELTLTNLKYIFIDEIRRGNSLIIKTVYNILD